MSDIIERLRAVGRLGDGLADEAADEIERLRAALTVIAAFDDMLASDRLATNGSYSGFDEPGSVEIARNALATK